MSCETEEQYFAMGKSALLDAFLQSDLDCAGFHLLNCPDLAGVRPASFPPVANSFLEGYDAVAGVFSARRPGTGDLNNWPDPTGAGGLFLKANATPAGTYSWATPAGGTVIGSGAINVKNTGLASGNAVGDGVTDDTLAIQGALNAAAAAAGGLAQGDMPTPPAAGHGGLIVYFPRGHYRITASLTPPGPVTMQGDGPFASLIIEDLSVTPAGPMLNLSSAAGSLVTRLGFDGNISSVTSGNVPVRSGISANGANSITIDNCLVFGCLGYGIGFLFSYYCTVRNTLVLSCGSFGIVTYFCPRSVFQNNVIANTQESGISIINGQSNTVTGNQIYSCAPFGYGLQVYDSDNSAVTGNLVQQCGVGVQLGISATRSQGADWDQLLSYGVSFVGNTVCRNYLGGVQIVNMHGFKVTGNVITDNGQGGSDATKGYTIEPGMAVNTSGAGTGYTVGDVLTLDPNNPAGTTNPAKCVVTRIYGSGKIWPSGLMLISGGTYASAWPTDPVNLIGGSGTGGKCVFSSSKISVAGSGYSVGQALRHNIGLSGQWNPVRIMVTGVGAGGAVTGYVVTDGGGYFDQSNATLAMIGDAYSPQGGPINGVPGIPTDDTGSTSTPGTGAGKDYPDIPDQGSGLVLGANWALRYSTLFNSGAGTTFNLQTYHWIGGGVVQGNVIDHCLSGCGYLNLGTIVPPWANGVNPDRAGYMTFTGNILRGNATPLSGGTVATGGHITLDGNYNVNALSSPYSPSSIFNTGAAFNSPLNVIR